MALTFLATMAEEKSHTRSRSMETSLRIRLDNGIPLTQKFLEYTHDINGKLVINPEEAPVVKLAFYMYLYRYSTGQIADTFIALGRRSYLGNINWTAGGIVKIYGMNGTVAMCTKDTAFLVTQNRSCKELPKTAQIFSIEEIHWSHFL